MLDDPHLLGVGVDALGPRERPEQPLHVTQLTLYIAQFALDRVEWDIRFANGEAAKGWEQLGAQAAGNTRAAWHLMRTDPAPATRTERHHRLKGEARGQHRGQPMDRWQIEVTAGGRVWYLLDVLNRTVWIDRASTGHPKATDH
ncbi:hypothetical protein ACFVFJ_48845 [Streptomyces sp. NPDC057717]|uniref:hypothetical protein n=1 Tax=Streptomyces sp. NPDC057717 TaxID=3346224 RepID=UPI00368D808A